MMKIIKIGIHVEEYYGMCIYDGEYWAELE